MMAVKNELQVLEQQFMTKKEDFEVLLPDGCTFEKFVKVIRMAAMQNPNLLKLGQDNITRISLFNSALECAKDGLIPDGKEAVLLITKKNKNNISHEVVSYRKMVEGRIKKILSTNKISAIIPRIVYENDELYYEEGYESHIKHKPARTNRGEAIAAYVLIKNNDNKVFDHEFMWKEDIEKIRATSPTEKYKKNNEKSMWDNYWESMAKKTVINQIYKRISHDEDTSEKFEQEMQPLSRIVKDYERSQQIPDISVINQPIIDLGDVPEIEEVKEKINEN